MLAPAGEWLRSVAESRLVRIVDDHDGIDHHDHDDHDNHDDHDDHDNQQYFFYREVSSMQVRKLRNSCNMLDCNQWLLFHVIFNNIISLIILKP